MDGEATPPPPAPAAGDSVSRVLEDDDLLVEILLRVGCPGGLVRAAAACRRWLGLASEPAFLRRFRELHPPVLLRFYLNDGSVRAAPRFAPMLEGLPELALEETGGRYILDCRNGQVITLRRDGDGLAYEVHRPLCPGIGVAALPPPPISRGYSKIFSREAVHGGGLSYFHVSMESAMDGTRLVQVHMLRDGVWRAHPPPPRLQVKHAFVGATASTGVRLLLRQHAHRPMMFPVVFMSSISRSFKSTSGITMGTPGRWWTPSVCVGCLLI